MLTDHELSEMVAEKVMELIRKDGEDGAIWTRRDGHVYFDWQLPFATDQGLALDAALKVSGT